MNEELEFEGEGSLSLLEFVGHLVRYGAMALLVAGGAVALLATVLAVIVG